MRAKRVAISGGPGGGKSTVAAAVARELLGRVVVVPEVATHLLGGFFPGIAGPDDRRAVQRAIYHVQVNLEAVHRSRCDADTVLVFDRGVLDGAAYWPDGCEAFFDTLCGDAVAARERYDAVLFLESAAQGGSPSTAATRPAPSNSARRSGSTRYSMSSGRRTRASASSGTRRASRTRSTARSPPCAR